MDETLLAVCLGLFSAVTLAAANMSVKMGGDILLSRAILSACAAAMIFPFALLVPLPDAATWRAFGFAVPAHFFYQMCMIRALQRGDLSLVFPVMRGTAPLLTAFTALLFLGEELAPLAWAGLVLATGAVAIFALPPRGTTMREHPHAAALFWAAGTAVGIALYNVTDAYGVRVAPSQFTFIVWLFLLDPIGVILLALVLRRHVLASALRMRWRYGAAGGALSILSFGSALYAFSLIETAKVSALRETSVVIAALMGTWFLGEGLGPRRIAAALVLAAGLVLMQFGG
jgi:drug/metabolite transporter (DMT)-like permease